MAHPSKRKGNSYEREIVNEAGAYGVDAERAYASNGRALGKTEDIDVALYGPTPELDFDAQAKRRKTLPKYLTDWLGNADGVIMREDRGASIVLMPLTRLLEMMSALNEAFRTAGVTRR